MKITTIAAFLTGFLVSVGSYAVAQTTQPGVVPSITAYQANATSTFMHRIVASGFCISGGGCLSAGSAIGTSTTPTPGQLAYWTSPTQLGRVATGTISAGTGLSVTAGRGAIGGSLTITADTGYAIPRTASTSEWATAYASTTALTPGYIRGLFSNTATGLTYSNGVTSLTAGYIIPLSASTTNWNGFYDTPSGRIAAGDALTWSGNTLHFDGGNTPGGVLGGTWASPTLDDASIASSTLNASNWAAGRLLQASSTASGGFAWVATSSLGISGGGGGGSDANWHIDGNGDLAPTTTVNVVLPAKLTVAATSTLATTTVSRLFVTGAVNTASLSLTTPLSIASGGTGEITASNAFAALSPLTTKGDLISHNGVTVPSRLAVGSNGTFLIASSSASLGLAWSSTVYGSFQVTGTSALATTTIAGPLTILGETITNFTTYVRSLFSAGTALTYSAGQFALNQAANLVWTGQLDFGGASFLEIPNGTNPTADDPGEIAHDTTANQIILDDNVFDPEVRLYGFQIASTSASFASGTIMYLPPHNKGYTITRVRCSVTSGTSKLINLFGETITCTFAGTTDDGSISSPTVTAGATSTTVTIGNATGTVNALNVGIFGTITRQ